MNLLRGLCALVLLVTWLPAGYAQLGAVKVAKIEIKHVGPAAVSDSLVRANIRVKPGDPYLSGAVDDDVRNLYATGLFYNIRVASENSPQGLVLTYIVQGNPRLVEIKFQGNKKFRNAKLRKLLTSKVEEPFNERKLFTDSQEIQKKYQKSGYPRTTVKYSFTIDENTGRATATFEITESPKVKIIDVQFVGAKAFPQKTLRKVIKTRRHWMFSWLTGSGYLKDEQFEEDKEKLLEYYRDHGYLDFELKDVKYDYPTPRKMIVRLIVFEGTQYRVGAVKFTGNKIFTLTEVTNGVRMINLYNGVRTKLGQNGLSMDVGDVFSPKGLTKDIEALEDFYGSKGYLDVGNTSRGLNVVKIPNTETGTMDIEFQLEEGQKSYIEKIEIRGNTKTRDKVIRRELAVSPGEVFDMFRVKRSKQRLEGLQYFEKIDTRPETTDVPGRKNLVVSVDEKNTGNISMGAGFSSIDQLVGFVELTQGNFDIFRPPTFTGGGQKFRLRVALGTVQQDYEAEFIEPWFLGKKLALGVSAFYRDLAYLSVNDIYDVTRGGGRVSLTRALGSDFLIGSVSYTMEDVGIHMNSGWNALNTPPSIINETGHNLFSRLGASLAYDTRNSTRLPNKGQRTELDTEFVGGPLGGDKEFFKLELKTGWYFKGLFPSHVLEIVGRTGVAKSIEAGDVPFYERYYLGGLYSLRGFRFHSISPREQKYDGTYFDEPVGGDTYWFGSAEYSIPIITQEKVGVRFALFYDIGSVSARPWSWNLGGFDDNYGFGLRLNLPIGPIRLDYGIPIHHDQFNTSSGRFGFGVGYSREF